MSLVFNDISVTFILLLSFLILILLQNYINSYNYLYIVILLYILLLLLWLWVRSAHGCRHYYSSFFPYIVKIYIILCKYKFTISWNLVSWKRKKSTSIQNKPPRKFLIIDNIISFLKLNYNIKKRILWCLILNFGLRH